ncbi:sensor histidine kinase [Candidatus Viridilinea mediisalina]|uniref:histidine kinase n=1 Tax=Candidatus Viridilinea mediisalina TaxID=2024553 RepID=A0A2A6RE85_9CHLR|nr:ATP-binding protein [Candidatus Viridilinea mediisalina]PDW00658.1 hypothetical protein CJ255_20340 [Candidatus Viridilinea mediisalina]
MDRLWLQLTLGFALVTCVAIFTVAFVAQRSVAESFRGYVARSQVLESGLLDRLASHYATNDSWVGVETGMTSLRGAGRGAGPGPGSPMSSNIMLTDRHGRVVADPQGLGATFNLERTRYNDAIPIMVEGETVGYVLVLTSRGAALPLAAQSFLEGLNRAIWSAGLLAGGLGLILGLLIARGIAAPLQRLANGARRIAQGHLNERVPARGPTEVQAVAVAFNEMAGALEAGEIQRRQMVADIAHELRTPLTVVQGNLRAILDDVYPLDKREVTTIYETTLGLRRLVDDLRDLSLAEAGRLDLHRQAVNVAALLDQEVALFAELAASQTLSLAADVAPALPPLHADPQRLAQIFHNLVSNALRYTPAGGSVRLTAEPDGPTQIRFSVIDNGVGIAPEELPHIFDRFYRADRARSRASGGSGLGLAITRELVRLHGGNLTVTSSPGTETRFCFSLPVFKA